MNFSEEILKFVINQQLNGLTEKELKKIYDLIKKIKSK